MFSNSNKRGARRARWYRAAALAAVGVAAVAALAGCASTSSETPPPATVKLVPVSGSSEPNIVLTQLGADRIGLETQPVTVGSGGQAIFPYTALLYEPNGQAVVYVESAPFTFTRHLVNVAGINSSTVAVTSGVTPGDRVATDGAEELLGVQNGVGEET